MWFQLTQGLTMFKCRPTLRCFVGPRPPLCEGVCHTTLNQTLDMQNWIFLIYFLKEGGVVY